jgi:hypothetical protein
MKFKKLVARAIIAQGMAMLVMSGANASAIIFYTGNDFTMFTPPYTGADKVTATLTLASPLGPSLNLASVTPVSFTLSDGRQTITQSTPGIIDEMFVFSTDTFGSPRDWNVEVASPDVIIVAKNITNQIQDFSDNGAVTIINGLVNNNAGIWAPNTAATSPVPEPSTISVLAAGLLSLVFLRRRRGHSLDLAQ